MAGLVGFAPVALADAFPPLLDLATLDGTNGFVLHGAPFGEASGFSVSGAGDVDGDGFVDLIIGAPAADAGAAHVVFGGPAIGSGGSFELAALDGANGFVLVNRSKPEPDSPRFSHLGAGVSGVGDLNGDGFDDVAAVAPSSDRFNGFSGATFVVFGGDDGFPPSIASWTLDGTTGFIESPFTSSDEPVGAASAPAGDVNGDGFDDLIIGTPGGVGGASYVLFGKPGITSTPLAQLDGTNGFAMLGLADSDRTGFAVAGGGDINGDGFADVVVAAPNFPPDDPVGATYVVFGGAAIGDAGRFDLASLDGHNGFVLLGARDNSSLSIGDVNGDGFADVVIGAENLAPNGTQSGGVFVVFGTDDAFPATTKLSSLDGRNGFLIAGAAARDFAGSSVSAGDVSGDAIDDIVIGAPRFFSSEQHVPGTSYVVFGGPTLGASGRLELSTLDGTNGFELIGAAPDDHAGHGVSAAGDVNGDGIGDIVIGAPGNGGDPGASYVVFGKAIHTATCTADAKPRTLWPPNHRLLEIATTVTVHGGSGTGFELVSVTSNERDSGLAGGDVPRDLQGWSPGTPDTRGSLRAERDPSGSGRAYTLTYRATGGATCDATVVVPHDQGAR